MRKITTAITAAALAFSMLAAAVPAAAVTGYDSAYAGESAFVNITPGQTQNFQVFFANTGTTSWTKGGATQVDLAACLEDKVTCNTLETSKQAWNSGWLSTTRYATTTQTVTPPGSLGTFSYNIMAPTTAAAGIYRFNGDLVLSSSGEKIHPEGYYQEANTGAAAGAATITSLTPTQGSSTGGTTVTITGTGIICNPTFPTTSFGGTNAVVTSCGSTTLTATTPAHAPGSVTVTVTNPGGGASNGLTFVYQDTTTPKFNSFTVSGSLITATWSKPVCRVNASANPSADWSVRNVSAPGAINVTGDSIPLCNAAADNGITDAILQLASPMPNGAFVETTLNAVVIGTSSSSRNANIRDAAGNTASAPQSRQATATAPDTTAPTFVSASGTNGTSVVTLTFSKPVQCVNGWTASGSQTSTGTPRNVILNSFSSSTDPSVTAANNGYVVGSECGTSPITATSRFKVQLNSALVADRSYTVTINCGTPGNIQDINGNNLACPSSSTFTSGAQDFTPPIIIDARMTAKNACSSDFACSGDTFSLTFSKTMQGQITGTIDVQDQDGTTGRFGCPTLTTGVGGQTPTGQTGGAANCSWNTAVTTLTVSLTAAVTYPPAGTNGSGTTPGLQIPFNITALTGFTDVSNNPVNVLGSSDRLVRYR
jgi:hypothetical protein